MIYSRVSLSPNIPEACPGAPAVEAGLQRMQASGCGDALASG